MFFSISLQEKFCDFYVNNKIVWPGADRKYCINHERALDIFVNIYSLFIPAVVLNPTLGYVYQCCWMRICSLLTSP